MNARRRECGENTVTGNADSSGVRRSRNFRSGSRNEDGAARPQERGWDAGAPPANSPAPGAEAACEPARSQADGRRRSLESENGVGRSAVWTVRVFWALWADLLAWEEAKRGLLTVWADFQ